MKNLTPELWRRFTEKNELTLWFTYIDVNFYVAYEGHQNWSKILLREILRVFGGHHIIIRQFWGLIWKLVVEFSYVELKISQFSGRIHICAKISEHQQ